MAKMFTPEEERDFLLDLYYDIKSVECAKERVEKLKLELEHLQEILSIN